ncbi:MAG: hypothetical protein H6625_08975 [Bdellovibrionaceae bacterium]|nr:hypothetical protein [Pseudobdellovibrionaceae bacterium]
MTCYSVGDVVTQAVKLKLMGAGVGLGFSKVKSVAVKSIGIGLTNGPESLYGKYSVGATAGLSLINRGYDFDAAVRLSKSGLGFELGFFGQDVNGLEAHLHGMVMTIKPDKN